MASTSQESNSQQFIDEDDTVFVAVGNDVEESKSTLLWALSNFPAGTRLCILHVHQKTNTLSGDFLASRLEQHEVVQVHELGRRIMNRIMEGYVHLCHQEAGVNAEKMVVEMDDVGNGIVELVYQHGIKKLVMGAAANKHYCQEMRDLKSRKAKYVRQCTPPTCQTWFICNGLLIHTGEGDLGCNLTETSADESPENNGLEIEVFEVPEPEEGNSIKELYDLLDQAMVEAETLKQEAIDESQKRRTAVKAAVNAVRRVNVLENLYYKELRQRKETEEAVEREKEAHRMTKNQRDEERVIAMDKRMLLEVQVGILENKLKESEDTVLAAVERCEKCKKETDELVEEHEMALALADELQVKLAVQASSIELLPMFSLAEIHEATNNFDPSNKIGEGGYGRIYKGFICHTPVAVKVLNPDSLQGAAEFQQEVKVLSKLRHPNLVSLMGACQESCALIYEYMPNGNLEDRLNCNSSSSSSTPPLPWQARIRIATELCSVLIFLHSTKPNSIVHGDLKPSNVLLDANLGCKLGDFGICRALPGVGDVNSSTTLYHITNPKGTLHYLDPHFLTTGELSPKSDTYSFGIILLQLLTGKPAVGIANETRFAMDEDNLGCLLDQSAGDWPYLQAKQLARVALLCCDMNRSRRPDLGSDVWKVLEPMRGSWGSSVPINHQQPPSHFFCPILQEVMEDPHVAADGFTYEAEALRGWLDSEHDTSPMTNLRLEHHYLLPNRSLKSAIQEWLLQPR